MRGEAGHASRDDRPALAALYALAREACTGAKVLDLAPGDGSGPALLAGWGARTVLAIGSAPPVGETPARLSYLDADPCGPYRLDGTGPFDLIVALGLPAGPRDDRALLATVQARLAPGGIAIVRFPAGPEGARAAAAALPAMARDVLGPPTQILVSMPVTGVILVDSEVRRLDPASGIREQQELYLAARVAGGEGRIERAGDIVMAWGQTLPDAAGIAYAPEPSPARPGLLGRLFRRRATGPGRAA